MSHPQIPAQQLSKYFQAYTDIIVTSDSRHVDGLSARTLFLSQKIEKKVLYQIWNMCDRKEKGKLTKGEFCSALFLIDQAKQQIEIPITLPQWLEEFMNKVDAQKDQKDQNEQIQDEKLIRQSSNYEAIDMSVQVQKEDIVGEDGVRKQLQAVKNTLSTQTLQLRKTINQIVKDKTNELLFLQQMLSDYQGKLQSQKNQNLEWSYLLANIKKQKLDCTNMLYQKAEQLHTELEKGKQDIHMPEKYLHDRKNFVKQQKLFLQKQKKQIYAENVFSPKDRGISKDEDSDSIIEDNQVDQGLKVVFELTEDVMVKDAVNKDEVGKELESEPTQQFSGITEFEQTPGIKLASEEDEPQKELYLPVFDSKEKKPLQQKEEQQLQSPKKEESNVAKQEIFEHKVNEDLELEARIQAKIREKEINNENLKVEIKEIVNPEIQKENEKQNEEIQEIQENEENQENQENLGFNFDQFEGENDENDPKPTPDPFSNFGFTDFDSKSDKKKIHDKDFADFEAF